MKKNPLKSKTVDSALIVIVLAALSLLGVGEKELGKTYDTITTETGSEMAAGKDILSLIAGAGAIYGRYKVKEKDDEDEE